MPAFVRVENLSIDFLKYAGGEPSLKADIISILQRRKQKDRRIKFRAVSDVNFYLESGDRLGVVGRNGAGKTTLMKAIAGIYAPAAGSIQLKGKLIPLLELGTGFDPLSSVRQNIYLNGAILNVPKQRIIELEPKILGFAELEDFADQPLTGLSYGMRSRLSFSIASFLDPEILLLDEVFAVGDKSFVKKAKSRMLELIEASKIVVFSSHQENQILEVCNKVVVMDKGRILFSGGPEFALEFYNEKIIKSNLN
jgi:ABC-type polysaccharide/polyol phosphate transport system ATPase subunit